MSDPEADRRLYKHARREAFIVLIVWALATVWAVGYCYLRGYDHKPDSWVVRAGLAEVRQGDEQSQVLGFPDWIFIGIIIPWLLCSAFTIWFGLYGMTDDDLGVEKEEDHGHGH